MIHNRANILGVGVSSTELAEVLAKIAKEKLFIVTVNPEFVMLAQDDLEFKNILNKADLAVPDGVGLKFARPGLAIIPGRKLVEEIINLKKYKIFYLGGQNRVAQEMAKKFGGAFDEGHQDIRSQILDLRENKRIINKVNKYKPDILLVAYGAPFQEKWLYANRQLLNARVCIGVGGAFDYLTGRSAIPPEWVNIS
ncbi:WecB/TagA/CpsF family glycosyltransferase [Candidatus Amesbacteria bacterium]|nr:WecB/TagA/CpsF family glycosyltransferase [Candidatus Amesbacteria bacterium]